MKTEKFAKTNETLNDNVNNAMKWMQESTALILETQNKQLKFATDLFNQTMNASLANFNTGNFNTSFESTEKTTDLIQKNIATMTKLYEENMKTIMDLNTEVGSKLFSKEILNQFLDGYSKQTEAITAFNQNAFDSVMKQSELSKTFFQPLAENFKTEFESNIQLYNDTVKEMMGSLSNFSSPNFEGNKNVFGELTNKMQNVFRNNLKSWSELMTKYSSNEFVKADPFEAAAKKAEQKDAQHSKGKLQPAHV